MTAQWGPNKPPTVLYPSDATELNLDAIRNRLSHFVLDAVEHGFTVTHNELGSYQAILERHHAPGSAASRAGVGFLLFGFIGAAIGAASTDQARTERIKIWVDSHGGVYVKHI